MNQAILTRVRTAAKRQCEYNESNKAKWRSAATAFCNALAADLGLPATWRRSDGCTFPVVSWNPGGIAVSGECSITAPVQGLHLHLSAADSFSYYRGATPADPYGCGMAFVNMPLHLPADLEAYNRLLRSLQSTMARATQPAQETA